MGATAEERLSKRRINELEEKLKKLQRELRELKVEKKHAGQLRKQVARAAETEATCRDIIDEAEIVEQERFDAEAKRKKKPEHDYKCKSIVCPSNQSFYKQSSCDIIEVGNRLIVICQECGSRYSVVLSN